MAISYYPNINAVYLAPKGFLKQLAGELKEIRFVHDLLIGVAKADQKSFWAQNIWLRPQIIKIESINDACRKLKKIQRNWILYSSCFHRRAKLIQDKLPKVPAKPLKFPEPPPTSPLGSWTLLDAQTILASAECSSPFPNGEIYFVEDKINPPNRAYLKLQEVLTLIGNRPEPGQFCIDVGASPGGWTWVLNKLKANVLAVDRSPLDPKLFSRSKVKFRKGNAFALCPEEFKDNGVDWMFCDVACYPNKLYPWVRKWAESGICKNIICTIKFQGENPYSLLPAFAKIPGSNVIRLFNNKHELTWIFQQ